jgi:hypothetical protein
LGKKKPGRSLQHNQAKGQKKSLRFSGDALLGTVEIGVESRKSTKKKNRNNVFNALDMGIKIGQGMELLQQTDRDQILAQQFGYLPVDLRQAAEKCSYRPDAD